LKQKKPSNLGTVVADEINADFFTEQGKRKAPPITNPKSPDSPKSDRPKI